MLKNILKITYKFQAHYHYHRRQDRLNFPLAPTINVLSCTNFRGNRSIRKIRYRSRYEIRYEKRSLIRPDCHANVDNDKPTIVLSNSLDSRDGTDPKKFLGNPHVFQKLRKRDRVGGGRGLAVE